MSYFYYPRVINWKYPALWLTGLGGVHLCKEHLLREGLDGGFRMDTINVLCKDGKYTKTHIQWCAICEKEGKGDATKDKVTSLANCLSLLDASDDEEQEEEEEEEEEGDEVVTIPQDKKRKKI